MDSRYDRGTSGGQVTTFAQGIALGALLQGITVQGRAYAGGWWEWLAPFSIMTGVGVLTGYSLLGACWLNWKTEGGLQRQAARYAYRLGLSLLVVIAMVSLATLTLEPQYHRRWLEYPGIFASAVMPLLILLVAFGFHRSIAREQDAPPFFYVLGLFSLCFLGLAISIWPDVVPARITIWEAAAPERSQRFMLVGAAFMIPIIVAYSGWSYWVFRGKVASDGYH